MCEGVKRNRLVIQCGVNFATNGRYYFPINTGFVMIVTFIYRTANLVKTIIYIKKTSNPS